MPDQFYPTINIDFVEEQILQSGKIIPDSKLKIGSTATFVTEGTQAIHKRLVIIREIEDGAISFENATAMALKFNFMGSLLKWLESNKNWKDGAYVEPQ
ncbi:MAG: hypothetical protein JNM14_16410 [Ferruginibacter sp.]|nr:hypothetical protein [Ferruginibacter sp.]